MTWHEQPQENIQLIYMILQRTLHQAPIHWHIQSVAVHKFGDVITGFTPKPGGKMRCNSIQTYENSKRSSSLSEEMPHQLPPNDSNGVATWYAEYRSYQKYPRNISKCCPCNGQFLKHIKDKVRKTVEPWAAPLCNATFFVGVFRFCESTRLAKFNRESLGIPKKSSCSESPWNASLHQDQLSFILSFNGLDLLDPSVEMYDSGKHLIWKISVGFIWCHFAALQKLALQLLVRPPASHSAGTLTVGLTCFCN